MMMMAGPAMAHMNLIKELGKIFGLGGGSGGADAAKLAADQAAAPMQNAAQSALAAAPAVQMGQMPPIQSGAAAAAAAPQPPHGLLGSLLHSNDESNARAADAARKASEMLANNSAGRGLPQASPIQFRFGF